MAKKVAVVQKDEVAEPLEVIADAVIRCAEGFKAIASSRLTQRAVILLLYDRTKVSMRDIESVLNAGANLANYYIKKPLGEKAR